MEREGDVKDTRGPPCASIVLLFCFYSIFCTNVIALKNAIVLVFQFTLSVFLRPYIVGLRVQGMSYGSFSTDEVADSENVI